MTTSERIHYIQSLFIRVQTGVQEGNTPETFIPVGDQEFISVVYEAAAVALATLDLAQNDPNYSAWNTLLTQYGSQHGSQIHVGLGWALAENAVETFPTSISAANLWRIADGFGYYSGLFKRREVVRQQAVPAFIPEALRGGFDQGLGRSIWYTSQGDPERALSMLQLFPVERNQDLFRGLGLAMAYVNGVDAALLEKLDQLSQQSFLDLRCGAVLAVLGKEKAGVNPMLTAPLRALLKLPENIAFSDELRFPEALKALRKSLEPKGV